MKVVMEIVGERQDSQKWAETTGNERLEYHLLKI